MFFLTNNGYVDILSDKATFGHLTNEKMKAIPLVIPPSSESYRILNTLQKNEHYVEKEISNIHATIRKLKEYRTAIISAAVTGKIDVRDWEK